MASAHGLRGLGRCAIAYRGRGGIGCYEPGQNILYPWGDEEPTCSLANTWPRSASPTLSTFAVCSLLDGNTDQGICDMAGNVQNSLKINGLRTIIARLMMGAVDVRACPENANDPSYDPNETRSRVYRDAQYARPASDLIPAHAVQLRQILHE